MANLNNYSQQSNENGGCHFPDRVAVAIEPFIRLFKKHSPYSIYRAIYPHLMALPKGEGGKKIEDTFNYPFMIMWDILEVYGLQNDLILGEWTDISDVIIRMVSHDNNLVIARRFDDLLSMSIETGDAALDPENVVIFNDLKRTFIEVWDLTRQGGNLSDYYSDLIDKEY